MKNKRLLIIILIGIAIISLAFYYVANKNFNNLNRKNNFISQTGKEYRSKPLEISVNIPDRFSVEESINAIFIKGHEGEIRITKQGTNYEKLDKYLENLARLNHFTITEQKYITSSQNEISAMIDNQKKAYFFYPAPWTVFTISTSSPELYNDLDQVAKSFRYTP